MWFSYSHQEKTPELTKNQVWCLFFDNLFLFAFRIRCCIQQIISRDVIELAEGDKVMDGHFIGSPFIPGIHGLRGFKNFCNLGLGQIIVLTQAF